MNVEIGAEAALFPEKEYISGIFVAVQWAACHTSHFSNKKILFSSIFREQPVTAFISRSKRFSLAAFLGSLMSILNLYAQLGSKYPRWRKNRSRRLQISVQC